MRLATFGFSAPTPSYSTPSDTERFAQQPEILPPEAAQRAGLSSLRLLQTHDPCLLAKANMRCLAPTLPACSKLVRYPYIVLKYY